MALNQEYLRSLGLEIAKKKYYNAARVESVIEEFHRHSAQLMQENRSLHERLDALSYGREEIGDAILSAKTLAQQILAEAQDKAAQILAEAQSKADALAAEAEGSRLSVSAACAAREAEAIERVRSCYTQLRELHCAAIEQLDGDWQRFLCSVDLGGSAGDGALPDDLGDKLGAIAAGLEAIDSDAPEE